MSILVEYGNYECPYCGTAHAVIKHIQKVLPGRLRFVFRHFPLTQLHPNALLAAQVAEAAALQGKFWAMHDTIYENQAELSPEALLAWSMKLGLDETRLRTDLERPALRERIEQDLQGGIRSGVKGTPTFFINGVRHDGAADYHSLLAALTASE